MSKHKNLKVATVESDEVSLDAALAEIESGDGEIAAPTEILEAALADVATTESKLEAYESQPGETAPVVIETTETAPAAKIKKVRTPRVSMSAGVKASDVIKASCDQSTLEALLGDTKQAASPEHVEATLAKIDTLDKKSREKATNLFSSVKAGKKPSVYINQTVEALIGSPLTLKGLTDYFIAAKYKIGTARRQASEMFALLPVVNIAIRDGGRGSAMSLNSDSNLLKAIRPAS